MKIIENIRIVRRIWDLFVKGIFAGVLGYRPVAIPLKQKRAEEEFLADKKSILG